MSLSAVQKMRKTVLRIAAVIVVSVGFTVQSMYPQDGHIHDYLKMLGIILIATAITGRAWCTIHIANRKKTELVRTGPYSMSRNPLYVFSMIAAFGAGLLSASVTLGVVFALVVFLVFDQVIRKEEAFLLDAFGEDYRRYLKETPRWFPRFSAYRDVEELVTRPKLFLITLRDGSAFFLLIPVFELAEYARDAGWIPVLLHLY